MGDIHFLNLEYLLLRAFYIVNNILVFFGFSSLNGSEGGPSHAAAFFTSLLGQIALIGMALALVFFALVVWATIRLLTVEHEGFHEKEIEKHEEAPAVLHVKNPQWERAYTLAGSPNESDWRRAILEADIMLGDLLEELGYRGKDLGEKLRDANPLQFSSLDLAWKAHKVRNDIAHGGEGFHLSQRDANATMDLYRRVFEEFGFI